MERSLHSLYCHLANATPTATTAATAPATADASATDLTSYLKPPTSHLRIASPMPIPMPMPMLVLGLLLWHAHFFLFVAITYAGPAVRQLT